ncbi:MAG: protein TolQ [Deltaproteobacteria bacterium]|jgi:biopolymer transport protein TolQ|nr:protein TolQ [Deltaproteobacteria bacterium]
MMAYAASESVSTPHPNGGNGIFEMIQHAGPMVKFILLALLFLSIACWFIILLKFRLIRRARKESEDFIKLFRQRKNYAALYRDSQFLEDSHLAQIFRIGYTELTRMGKSLETKSMQDLRVNPEVLIENVDRAIQGGMMSERQRFERFLPLLATTGSTAPFIGLFGTVWGIMTSFQDIGAKGAANLAVVAPGISEALVATAMGLAAAIPAVVAYNHFSNRIRVVENEMSHFSADFLNILKRDLMRRGRQEEYSSEQQRFAVQD